jgi:8-oxo-dGTP pyrophosphatase MutT (NUDIX family)
LEVRKLTFEKSCGAVVFRNERKDGMLQRYVLMIKHSVHSHHSFPKGHVEAGESEIMTAEREVMEETSVRIHINEKFRQPVYYRPKPGVKKEVVYFLAFTKQVETSPRPGEVEQVEWVPVEKAIELLAHENDKRVLSMAIQYVNDKK